MHVSPDTVIVVAGGGSPPSTVELPDGAPVIAADEGVDRALALGLAVDVAVGDFDSVSGEGLAAAEAAGARVERHPEAKDATDLELALEAALTLAPRRILVLGGDGGRLDHLVAALLGLTSEHLAGVEVDAHLGAAAVHVVRGERVLAGEEGETVSLLAAGGPAEGVTTEGLRFPLADETLGPGSSRGVSNAFAEPHARISVRKGTLLVIRPEAR